MSFLLGLLLGCGFGALGYHYFLNYSGAESHEGSVLAKKNNDMALLFQQNPYLMNLIKSNLSDPEYKNIREFFVVDRHAIMNSSVPRLRYDLSDETLALVEQLEAFAYVEQLDHDSLLFRMDEEFIEDLNSFDPLTLNEQESA